MGSIRWLNAGKSRELAKRAGQSATEMFQDKPQNLFANNCRYYRIWFRRIMKASCSGKPRLDSRWSRCQQVEEIWISGEHINRRLEEKCQGCCLPETS